MEWLDLYRSVSLCQPACRMVVIRVLAWKPNEQVMTDFTIFPVVALRASIKTELSREHATGRSKGVTEAELSEAGWRRSSPTDVLSQTALIVEEDGVLAPYDECPPDNCAQDLFACPWPPDEDEQRLRLDIEDLIEQVKQNKNLPLSKVPLA
jgi:hypothetical protein